MRAPMRRLTPKPVIKQAAERRAGRVSGSRLFSKEIKGHTHKFDELLQKKADIASNQVADPFQNYYLGEGSVSAQGGLSPVAPVWPFYLLADLVQNSNILRQCIESYVVNIESYGYTLEYIGPEGDEKKLPQRREKERLEAFISACSATLSLKEIRERSRWDIETVGNRAFEISRNLRGEIVMFDHIPFTTLRRTRTENRMVEVDVEVPNPADPEQMIKRKVRRRFCRYVQITPGGQAKVYFKEFGDPRPIDPKTGEVNQSLAVEDQATEILCLSHYTPNHFYGLPRWFGVIAAIMGSRESELVNLNFFKENAIPAMAVLVSGGALTQDSFETIEQYITSVKGAKAMQRIMVLEASADESSGNIDQALAAPKIDMKPMISERQQDGLFQAFDAANQGKVRSSFRLPPIYTGRAEDYTRASAVASMLTAENQIFIPERSSFDDVMNNKILRTYKPKYWRFKTLGAPITDSEALAKMIDSFEQTGALTPNAVIKIANKVLGVDIKPVTQKWGDYPFEIVKEYAAQGMIIDGMDEFLDAIKTEEFNPKPTVVQPSANGSTGAAKPRKPGARTPAPANANTPATRQPRVAATKSFRRLPRPDANVRRILRKEMNNIARDIENTLKETLQMNASAEAA